MYNKPEPHDLWRTEPNSPRIFKFTVDQTFNFSKGSSTETAFAMNFCHLGYKKQPT